MTEAQIYTLLSAAFSGTATVYNGWLPERANLPAVTFEYVSDTPENTLAGDTGISRVRYSFSVWADTGSSADSLKNTLLSTLASYYRVGLVPLHDEEQNYYRYAIDYTFMR
ncbi:tail completion protein gp17 [Pontibacter sp. JAM-7]|uniref:tail completion protein gp17 n=1 Tax=Pontibacter sp. JAM-7 TaxID=3366581 RepID=UPI003AF65D1B